MYKLQKHTEKADYWVCTDLHNLLVCEFREHHYNDDQKFTLLEDTTMTASEIALMAAKMGDWLRDNHYNIVF